MKLYLDELPASRLYLDAPEATEGELYVSKSDPYLYLDTDLVKAKYSRREGSPGNYKYYYDKPGDPANTYPSQTGFEFNEVATTKEIVDALNKIPGVHDKDFLSLAQELESLGVQADTAMIGDAFDTGKIKGPSEEVGLAIPGMEGPFNFPNGRTLYYDPSHEGGSYYDRGQDRYLSHEEGWRATSKSQPRLYLDLEKGNPHRDPSVGQFIAGGGGKAMGDGQEDLDEQSKDLMDTMPGEDVEKAKYIRREGSPGNYKYIYADKKGKERVSDTELPRSAGDMSNTEYAMRELANYFTNRGRVKDDDVKERRVKDLPYAEESK